MQFGQYLRQQTRQQNFNFLKTKTVRTIRSQLSCSSNGRMHQQQICLISLSGATGSLMVVAAASIESTRLSSDGWDSHHSHQENDAKR